MLPRILALTLAVALSEVAVAGGTLAFSEVEAVLKTNPAEHRKLTAAFILPDSAFAEIRLSSRFTHLGGARLGPYSFLAQPRNVRIPDLKEVFICTRVKYLGPGGKSLGEEMIETATRVQEEVISVVIREPQIPAQSLPCPL
jgi:hypothetical protein